MRSRGFDNVCETYAYLAGRRQLRTRLPRLATSMVLTRDNLEEVVEFVELAARLGADEVTFAHYISTTMVGTGSARRPFPIPRKGEGGCLAGASGPPRRRVGPERGPAAPLRAPRRR